MNTIIIDTPIKVMTSMPFPSVPPFKGAWQAIYLEPIVGSGERFCVAIAAKGDTGEYKVIQSINPGSLDCMYGNNSLNIKNMINWIIESVDKELNDSDSLDFWDRPFGGVSIGPKVNGRAQDIDGLLNQAIKFSSSLSADSMWDLQLMDLKAAKGGASEIEKWSKQVKDVVVNKNINLISCFNQKVSLRDSAYIKAHYGFINDKYASSFGLLLPNRMAASIKEIKLKLFDIELLKQIDCLFEPEKKDLIIGRPRESDPTVSDQSQEKIRENFKMLEEMAANDGIGIVGVYSPEEAGQHILDNAN